jgi:hypothetical protein
MAHSKTSWQTSSFHASPDVPSGAVARPFFQALKALIRLKADQGTSLHGSAPSSRSHSRAVSPYRTHPSAWFQANRAAPA